MQKKKRKEKKTWNLSPISKKCWSPEVRYDKRELQEKSIEMHDGVSLKKDTLKLHNIMDPQSTRLYVWDQETEALELGCHFLSK